MTASKVLVVYYSRTGATRRLAEALAKALQADIEPIIDRKNRSGIFGYLRSVAESLQKRGAAVEPMKTIRDPMTWLSSGRRSGLGRFRLPGRSYSAPLQRPSPRIVAFFCTMGSRGSERAFEEMQAIVGQGPL